MSFRVLTLTTSFLLAATATAADWPQWRGPNRDGVSQETGLLKKWPANGPPKVWTAKGLGGGYGSPIVVGGKIYGVGKIDGKEYVWCLKEADGGEVWKVEFATPTKGVGYDDGPRSTPTFHKDAKLGEVVYAVGVNGDLACLKAGTGELAWRKNYVKDFGGSVQSWGFTDSVLVDGDKVICAPGSNKAAIAALKADTGEVIWQTPVTVGGGVGYSSPIKATVGGVPMYILLLGQSGGIIGVTPDTGKLLWQYNKAAMGGIAQIPTPIVKDDRVWVSTGYSGGSALLKLTPEGKDRVAVEALKTHKTQLMNHHGGMVAVGDYIYFGHGQKQGNPVCVDFKTGEKKWGPEAYPAGGNGSAAVAYADGRLYFRYENGMMVLIEPSPEELKIVSSFKLPEPSGKPSWAHPVIANGKMYIRDQDKMHCFDVKATGASN